MGSRSLKNNATMKSLLLKGHDMRGIRIGNGGKAEAYIQACRSRGLGTEPHAAEMLARFCDERGDQCSSNALISPCRPHIDAPDPSNLGVIGEGIAVQTAYGDDQSLIEMTAEDFARRVEAVLSTDPIIHQRIDEVVSLGKSLKLQLLDSGNGQLDFLDRDHSAPD